MILLGIEIGGTKLQIALGTGEGEIAELRGGSVDAARGAEGIRAWLATEVRRMIDEAPVEAAIQGIGVGFGGPVDSRTGAILLSHPVAGWDGFALREWFEEQFGLPAVVVNDSNAAGWAEYRLGAGRGTRNMAYMNIGSGIGGALIIDGQLYDGQGYGAGEIGHTFVTVPADDGQGLRAEKLEDFCSGWSIERRARARWKPDPRSPLARLTGGQPARLTCDKLADAVRQNDPFARQIVAEVAQAAGVAIGNLCSLVCPEKLVLGGGVAGMGEVLLAPLREVVKRHTIASLAGRTQVVAARLAQAAVPHGALLLAGQKLSAST